ncbi:hypothetical protein D4R89_04205 [bacterium]|nr:MAG: hypothetical protein D4R89_04205 [bacterium]
MVGYKTKYPDEQLAGYYNGNIVYIMNSTNNSHWYDYLEGYYFTFQGTTPTKQYICITNEPYSHCEGTILDVKWRGMWATKLSSSTASTEIMTLSDVLNQKALKIQALLRECMTARTLLEKIE